MKKDIPNVDFECKPEGNCWCMEEHFPPLSGSSDICYSYRNIQKKHNVCQAFFYNKCETSINSELN